MAIDKAAIAELTRINLADLFESFGLTKAGWLQRCLAPFFRPIARSFARQVLGFDQAVARQGLQTAAEGFLADYVRSHRVDGAAAIPSHGPLLILANHPGMTDTLALFAAIDRADLKVLAGLRPFLAALPAVRRQMLFIPEAVAGRSESLRQAIATLRAGGVVLTFPAGRIEPDPAVLPGATAALADWSASIAMFVRMVPGLAVLPAIVSGVIAAPSLRNPLLRLRRKEIQRHQLAASLQIIMKLLRPRAWPVDVRVSFGEPLIANQLSAGNSSAIHQALLARVCPFMQTIVDGYRSGDSTT